MDPTLANVTTLVQQLITDANTMVTSNGSDSTGATSETNLEAIKGDVRSIQNLLTGYIQSTQYGT